MAHLLCAPLQMRAPHAALPPPRTPFAPPHYVVCRLIAHPYAERYAQRSATPSVDARHGVRCVQRCARVRDGYVQAERDIASTPSRGERQQPAAATQRCRAAMMPRKTIAQRHAPYAYVRVR